jgi:uncharacterized protein YdeI (YjbR/CyaY-like superfamily)
MNPEVDLYLEEGCGRCSLYRTPQCKVHNWSEELKQLRRIVLECDLVETYKWSQPCYMYGKSNVLIMAALKNHAVLSFFKGSLLDDPNAILEAPGQNSQAVRYARFTSVKEIIEMEPILKAYIYEAIEVEKLGLKVDYKNISEPVPEELLNRFDAFPELKSAFESLTPGRQRAYILYFSQAKQSKTRESRIDRYVLKILSGKGLTD